MPDATKRPLPKLEEPELEAARVAAMNAAVARSVSCILCVASSRVSMRQCQCYYLGP